MSAVGFDERVVRLSLSINGLLKTFSSPMFISSTGKKCANPLESEIEVKIANLTKDDSDYLLSNCSPFNKNPAPKILILEAGRASIGTTVIFSGNITSCCPTQPPDVMLTFKCQANQFLKGQLISSQQAAATPLSKIAEQVAGDCGLTLNFQAADKNISNYAFTGGALKQVDKLSAVGGVNAFVDGNELVVTNLGTPIKNALRVLNAESGMVGIPEITEQGIKVKYLLDNQSRVGGALQVESVVYPSISGFYHIYSLGWEIATREPPFYWVAECQRVNDAGAVVIPTGVKKRKGKRA